MPFIGYEPIKVAYTLNGLGFPPMERKGEAATQTFEIGVPLKVNAGFLDEVDFLAADIIYGISVERGSNLAVAGVKEELSIGNPPNQPSGKIIPIGAPLEDGKVGIIQATGDVVFSIMLEEGDVFVDTLVAPGTLYGLVKDGTSGFWFLDADDTAGDNAVAEILGLDESSPNTVADGARVFIRIGSTKRAFA